MSVGTEIWGIQYIVLDRINMKRRLFKSAKKRETAFIICRQQTDSIKNTYFEPFTFITIGRIDQLLGYETSCFDPPRNALTEPGSIPDQDKLS